MPIYEGWVDEVVFKNEQNGWLVMELRRDNAPNLCCVGVMPFLDAGERVRVEGEWTEHRDYGMQLKVAKYECIAPTTKNGIERYLASGLVRGVGPATAKALVKRFGTHTLEVMENEPWRLTELEGIGAKKAEMITESFASQRETRKAMVFLAGFGLSPSLSKKVYDTFGDMACDIVKSDPYRLADEVPGVGFRTADGIAISLGFAPEDEHRLRAGVVYALNESVSASGHTYLPKSALISEAARLLTMNDKLIERAFTQLMLANRLKVELIEGEECAYPPALHAAETEVASRLALLNRSAGEAEISADDVEAVVARYERDEGVRLSALQRDAVLIAATSAVTVVTGGPGTGKTTLINCLILLMGKGGKLELCAPTGRAAKRMSEATGRDARTIHRLLEFSGDEPGFKKNANDQLDAKVVIVDEMSMVDIHLMRSLLAAIKPGCRLVLVGDADQLPSVGAGNVLGDLILSGALKVIKLTEVFRQAEKSAIIVNAHRINRGDMPVANKKDTDFFMERVPGARVPETVRQLVMKRLPDFMDLDPFRDIQVMTPMKKGESGVNNLNLILQESLNPPGNRSSVKRGDTSFRMGDKVMQIKNDYSLEWRRGEETGQGVFNGDIGFVSALNAENRALTVEYDDGRYVDYTDDTLEELELAYCLSVHKSQGSEFGCVVIPLVSGPPMLMTRNLLYTAVTRARKLVVIVGREECVRAMVNNNHVAKRYSRLAQRLKSAAEGR